MLVSLSQPTRQILAIGLAIGLGGALEGRCVHANPGDPAATSGQIDPTCRQLATESVRILEEIDQTDLRDGSDWERLDQASIDEQVAPIRRGIVAHREGWRLLGDLIDHCQSHEPTGDCLDAVFSLAGALRVSHGRSELAASVIAQAARLLDWHARPDDSELLFRRAIGLVRNEHGEDHSATMLYQLELASLLIQRGDLGHALQIVASAEAHLSNGDHGHDARCALAIANIHWFLGRTAEAASIWQSIWHGRENELLEPELVALAGLRLSLHRILFDPSESGLRLGTSLLERAVGMLSTLDEHHAISIRPFAAMVLSSLLFRMGENDRAASVLAELVRTLPAGNHLAIKASAMVDLLRGPEVDHPRWSDDMLDLEQSRSETSLQDQFLPHLWLIYLRRIQKGDVGVDALAAGNTVAVLRERLIAQSGGMLSRSAMQSLFELRTPITQNLAAGASIRASESGEPEPIVAAWRELAVREAWSRAILLDLQQANHFRDLGGAERRPVVPSPVRAASASPLPAIDSLDEKPPRQQRPANPSIHGTDDPSSSQNGDIAASLLEPEEAIVDFVECFMGFDRASRMAAIVIRKDRAPQVVDLGPTASIARQIESFRTAIGRHLQGLARHEEKAAAPLRTLADLLWEPLRTSLDGVESVFASVDDPLHGLPLEALVVGSRNGRPLYLLETGPAIRYVSSGREVVDARRRLDRGPSVAPSPNGAVLVGAPDFGSAIGESSDASRLSADGPSPVPRDRFTAVPAARDLIEQFRATIESLGLAVSKVLVGSDASEDAMLGLVRPVVLQLVTHGFVTPSKSTETTLDPQSRMLESDPWSRSFLAMAGANRVGSDAPAEGDGLLSAAEVSRLDLRGTELVVLTACRSGVGETLAGQGLAGLHAAFHCAGARYVLASRWDIYAPPAIELFDDFWRARKFTDDWHEAYRAAQRQALERGRTDGTAHPIHWAAFRLSGM